MKGESESVTEANAIRTHGNRIRKIYQFGAILIAVAMISSGLTLIAIGDGPSGFETEIGPGALVDREGYVIYKDGSDYYARNTMTGVHDYSGTVASTVLQSAIDASTLIDGTITILDDMTFDTSDVQMEDNVVLAAGHDRVTFTYDAFRITFNSVSDCEFKGFTIDAASLGARNAIAIYGGCANISLIELNILNCVVANSGVLIWDATDVVIRNCNFENCGATGHPIQIEDVNRATVYGLTATGPTPIGQKQLIIANSVTNISISSCKLEGIGLCFFEASHYPSNNIIVTDNHVGGYNNYAIAFTGGLAGAPMPSNHIVIANNVINAGPGLYSFNGIAVYGLSHDVVVSGNVVNMTENGHNGISVSSGIGVTVANNVVRGSTDAEEGGIEVESNPVHNDNIGISENVSVTGNVVHDCNWGIYVRIMDPAHANWAGNPLKSKNITISDNTAFDCAIGINLIYGDHVYVYDNNVVENTLPLQNAGGADVINEVIQYNYGYATEASGVETITGAVNTVTVTHGLDETPTIALAIGNNTGIGDTWITTIGAATFVISFESQPGASTWTFYWYAEVR